jgi:hypothetical protein
MRPLRRRCLGEGSRRRGRKEGEEVLLLRWVALDGERQGSGVALASGRAFAQLDGSLSVEVREVGEMQMRAGGGRKSERSALEGR